MTDLDRHHMIKKKILIIEDSKSDKFLIEKSLDTILGDIIVKFWAESITESRKILLEQEIDLIILDLYLTDSNGYDSINNLRQFSGETPIIVFTALGDEKLRYRALSTGIRGYLTKSDEDSYRELAELIIQTIQQNYNYKCYFHDCPQYINSIRTTLLSLVENMEELKKATQSITIAVIGNGKPGYEVRIQKLEGFHKIITKYWWVMFPIIAAAIIGSFFV
jgi:DNA-binding response OmpR family regulator